MPIATTLGRNRGDLCSTLGSVTHVKEIHQFRHLWISLALLELLEGKDAACTSNSHHTETKQIKKLLREDLKEFPEVLNLIVVSGKAKRPFGSFPMRERRKNPSIYLFQKQQTKG